MWPSQSSRSITFILIIACLVVLPGIGLGAAIHEAAARGDLEAVKKIVGADPEAIGATDEIGRRPLHWACRGDHPDLVAFLLAAGADVDATDNFGNTPLHNLAHRNLVAAIKAVLARAPKLNHQNHEKSTALHYAAAADASDAVAVLVAAGAELELRDDYGRTALVLCARERGGAAATRALLAGGADPNAADRNGDTALDLAAWRGKAEVVDLLLAAGAKVPSAGQRAEELMSEAAAHGLTRLFHTLVEAGANPDFALDDGGTLVHRAAAGGSRDILELLIARKLDVDAADRYGWTPLHYACRDDRARCAQLLISKGAKTGVRNLMGQTPFNVAEEMSAAAAMDAIRAADGDTSALRFPALEGPYLGQEPPGDEPQPFAIGIVSSIWGLHSSVSFSPSGDVALWAPMVEVPGKIYSQGGVMMSRREGDRWQPPRWAPFSGEVDGDVPFFAPDGKRVYFIATRAPEDQPESVRERIWYADRLATGWADPRPVDAAVNDFPQHWQFAVDGEHSIYFSADLPGGRGGGDLYVSVREQGRWTEAVNLGAPVNTDAEEATPYIAPDGSYLIFQRDGDLFISHRAPDGGWDQPRDLCEPINSPARELCPMVSPDGRFLFFLSTRDGGRHVWWVSAAGVVGTKRSAADAAGNGSCGSVHP